MLVLSRMQDEQIIVTTESGEEVTITVVDVRGNKVRLGVDAKIETAVHRGEVHDALKRQGKSVFREVNAA